jgi:hypothetical protein
MAPALPLIPTVNSASGLPSGAIVLPAPAKSLSATLENAKLSILPIAAKAGTTNDIEASNASVTIVIRLNFIMINLQIFLGNTLTLIITKTHKIRRWVKESLKNVFSQNDWHEIGRKRSRTMLAANLRKS